MSQETRVFEIAAGAARELERELRDRLPASADWRPAPHARFSVKHDGVVLTVYESGKGVLQGARLDAFAREWLSRTKLAPARTAASARFDVPTLGSDEVGKGDYFGPLVVAAVFATPGDREFLEQLGVADSKTLTDDRMRKQVGPIEKRLDHVVLTVMPPEYNERHASAKNLNVLLADLHAEALATLFARHPDAEQAVVDQFANAHVLERALKARGARIPGLEQRTGGESHVVVAAASVLARVHFLEGLQRCSDECGTDLHKGAGAPVDVAAARVLEIGGRDLLAKVAKLHFKNTKRLRLPSP